MKNKCFVLRQNFKMVSTKVLATVCFALCFIIIVVFLHLALRSSHTIDMKKIFMDKCVNFSQKSEDCEAKCITFQQAYVGKDECDVTPEDYNQLFNETAFNHPHNKTMFWSGNTAKDLVHQFTKNRNCFYTLEDTLLGFVLNGLVWCGKKGSKDTYTSCNKNCRTAFWEKASEKLAQYASETVTVMLDGGRDEPFDMDSTFGRVEVPNLNPAKVKQLDVVLVNEEMRNTCSKQSLQSLLSVLDEKKIAYSCKEVTSSHIQKCMDENTPCGTCW